MKLNSIMQKPEASSEDIQAVQPQMLCMGEKFRTQMQITNYQIKMNAERGGQGLIRKPKLLFERKPNAKSERPSQGSVSRKHIIQAAPVPESQKVAL
jgi:hypothetical protein